MDFPNFEDLVINIGFKDKIDELKSQGKEGEKKAKELIEKAKSGLGDGLKNAKKDISDSFDKVKSKSTQMASAIKSSFIEVASIPAAIGTPFTLSTAPTFINNAIKSLGTLKCSITDLMSEFTGLTGKLESLGITPDVLPEPLKTTYSSIKSVIDGLTGELPKEPAQASLTIQTIEIYKDNGNVLVRRITENIPNMCMIPNEGDTYIFKMDSILNTLESLLSTYTKDLTYLLSDWDETTYTVRVGEEKVIPILKLYYSSE